ncbi:MAG: hypothetical protein KF718_31750 [Polyangiaceae bacterium]|nr:hypothetical protein [Polyangiaceae bacterium]
MTSARGRTLRLVLAATLLSGLEAAAADPLSRLSRLAAEAAGLRLHAEQPASPSSGTRTPMLDAIIAGQVVGVVHKTAKPATIPRPEREHPARS